MRKLLFLMTVAVAGVALADGADDGLVEQESNNPWHFRIGPVLSPRVRVKVKGPRIVPQTTRTPGTTSGTGSTGAPAGPSAGYVSRTYSDGYVNPDEGTEDPDSMISGLTWDWGADDVGSQYSGGKMQFHTDMTRWTETVTSSSFGSGSGNESDHDALIGVEAMGGWSFLDDEIFDAAIDGGFRFYGSGDLKAKSAYGTSTTTTRNEYRLVDSYDASGWTDVPSGSYTGTPGGPGRIIGAMPDRSEQLMGSKSSSETYYYRSSSKLEYRIWDIRLGPTVGWKATDYLTIRGGVYGLLGFVDADFQSPKRTANGYSRVNKSKCDAVFGVAAGLSAQIDITDSLFIMGGAEYDWWSDDITLNAGGADARIELSDITVSLSLGLEF